MTDPTPPVLEARNITKRFPGVIANDRVNFKLEKGHVHALLGENGAGKSTLMNIIYGLYNQDEGEILIDGKPVKIDNPHDAIDHGIGMVHQHFMLVPVFSVAENIILGQEEIDDEEIDRYFEGRFSSSPIRLAWYRFVRRVGRSFNVLQTRLGKVWALTPIRRLLEAFSNGLYASFIKTIQLDAAKDKIVALSNRYGLAVNPEEIVEDLPVGIQQRVEILKALYRDANILVLDEPTSVLTPQESGELFEIMDQLTQRGVSIIFISHKLKEVLFIADKITVMRRGHVVGTTTPKETNEQGLAEMMVGREVLLEVVKTPANPKGVVLDVYNLTIEDARGVEVVRNVTFQVQAGEILGIAGVQGNGQTELAETLTGLREFKSGTITLNKQVAPPLDPRALIELGLAHVPEDRQKHGLVLPYHIGDNQVLCTYYQSPFANGIQRNERAILNNAQRLISQFDIRGAPGPLVPVRNLSGGNQQKVIIARELSRDVHLLIANQPTRGLDVGSIEYIHRQVLDLRDQGVAVLLISAELDEVLSLSDRIAVMFHGEIIKILPAEKATRSSLGLMMAGSVENDS
ncbi:MAG TPA: ABC transporter ATP-binding protein [Anaerolineales bacterium]|nr:ABC transporter ATP-binding protein [Anaerolineales bacterium]